MSFFSRLFQRTDINEAIKKYREDPDAILIDVREPGEFRSGHIPGAVNIPLSELSSPRRDLSAIPDKNTSIYVYCLSGSRSGNAAGILRMLGYSSVRNIGGIGSYMGTIEK